MVLQWVSTQEELPNDMEDILIFNEEDGAEHIGYFFAAKRQFIRYLDGENIEKVTHWMPLPKPPKFGLSSLRR